MVDAVLNRPFNLKVARDRKGMAPGRTRGQAVPLEY